MTSRIPTSRSTTVAPAAVTAPIPRPAAVESREAFLPPRRPGANFIPSAEQIGILVARAQAAFSRGIFWDRGSIINVLL